MTNDDNGPDSPAPGMWQIIRSVLASAIGVQSRRNFESDTQSRSALPYIFVGLIGTVTFVALVIIVVKLVLRSAGV